MKTSESIANIAASLVKFNQSIGRIEKDGTNPHLKNRYATLDNIIDEVRPKLAENGIFIMQSTATDESGSVAVTTRLIHSSGEWMESDTLVMKPVKNDPQGLGSACSYGKRYSLSAFLSLNTGEDDDGDAATRSQRQNDTKPQTDSQPQGQPNNQPTNLVSEAQAKAIHAKANELAKLMNTTKYSIFSSLTHENYLGPFQSVETLDKQRGSKAIELLNGWIKTRKEQPQQ